MTQAIGTVLTVLATIMWDERVILMMSDGRAITRRGTDWAPSYCVTRSAGVDELADGEQCDNYSCTECFVSWSPGYEFPRQGTFNNWHMAQTRLLSDELVELRHKVEHEMIEIAHVQQVAHDYAVHGEWCSVYEQAMDTLSRVSGKEVTPLDATMDVTVTYTVNLTVRADRRQRIGDVDFLRRSVAHWRVEDHFDSFDPFDSDFEVESSNVISVEIEEQ